MNNGAVQSLIPNSGLATTAVAACANDNLWLDMTDPNVIVVTGLVFDFGGSTCMTSADPLVYKPTVADTYVSWVSTSPTAGSACAAAPATPASAATLLASGAFAETRQVTIRMVGQTNGANAVVRQPLIETVQVRNHRMRLP